MQYFTRATLNFLAGLARHNNKEWFRANKKVFKEEVEAPFTVFIADMIDHLSPYIPDLNVEAKDCIYRIYRDTRFSKDKTPYKTHISAVISKGGRQDKTTPGAYIQISAADVRLYSGCFELTPRQREKLRTYIVDNLDVFGEIIHENAFVNTFGEISGERYKKIPEPCFTAAKTQPLLLNKSFYYFKTYPADLILSPDLLPELLGDYQKAIPINSFLLHALQ